MRTFANILLLVAFMGAAVEIFNVWQDPINWELANYTRLFAIILWSVALMGASFGIIYGDKVASPEKIQALVQEAKAYPQAKDRVAQFLASNESPSNYQVIEIKREVDRLIVAHIASDA